MGWQADHLSHAARTAAVAIKKKPDTNVGFIARHTSGDDETPIELFLAGVAENAEMFGLLQRDD
jgi:hypothetical protein